MNFIEILESPITRPLVDSIEDLSSSLESYPDGEPVLESMRDSVIAELEAVSGFRWVL